MKLVPPTHIEEGPGELARLWETPGRTLIETPSKFLEQAPANRKNEISLTG